MSLVKMPLFPLNTVLFPGARLPLRIFEPRYLSMIGNCMRRDEGFAVVLIHEGQEAGRAAAFHSSGTAAKIVDFDQLDNGMLGVTCLGEQRVRVISHETQADQLIVAEVELLESPSSSPLPIEYNPLQDFLRNILDQEEAQPYRSGLTERWDDSNWISYRLAELLPLTLSSKQALLEMDGKQRLAELKSAMQESQLI